MKTISILPFLVIACLSLTSCSEREAIVDPYIKFKYIGKKDSLIPQVVFFPKSISKDVIGFGTGIMLTKKEFEKVKSSVENNSHLKRIKVANDSVNAGTYNFYIRNKSGIVAYHCSEKQIAISLFNTINGQLIDSVDRRNLLNTLEMIFE
jgi:hypothetical protein